ncbi:MAG: dihydrodipicolinate synthase family protein [bacterium]|nr:dihydrodipicolinate synthase family protein [bacterium]
MPDLSLEGVFPPIPTPFDANGSIAAEGLAGNLKYLGRFALAGYVVLGSNGEAAHLNGGETLSLLEQARMHIPSDRLMIVGTGRNSTKETVNLTFQAADLGADAALVLPPCYYRGLMTREVLVRHFRSVADASQIPVMVYNMPGCTGMDLDAETVLEVAEHPNVIGIKDSGGNVAKLAELRQYADPSFAILAGSAGFFLPALSVGAQGGVFALANIAPQPCIDIFNAYQKDDWAVARSLQLRMVRPNAAVTRKWGVPALKAAMDMLGLYGGAPRLPLFPLADEHRRELVEVFADAGIDLSANRKDNR